MTEYSIIDISRIFNIKYETVRRWVVYGLLKANMDEKPYKIDKESLFAFIKRTDNKKIKTLNRKRFFTPEEIGSLLNINRNSVTRYIKNKTIVAYKVGGMYRIEEKEFLNYVEKRKKVVASKFYCLVSTKTKNNPEKIEEVLKSIGRRTNVNSVLIRELYEDGKNFLC